MGILDKVIAAVTPPESEEARVDARRKARGLATQGSWLEQVLDHHLQIDNAFEAVRFAQEPEQRRAAQRQLAMLLTGHSMAEEAVLYPALALNDEKIKSEMSFVEQSAAKVQVAALEDLDPLSQDFLDKLEHLRGAVAHHVYEEESSRYPALLEKASAVKNEMLSMRYREESARYFGTKLSDAAALPGNAPLAGAAAATANTTTGSVVG